jgi:osmotically-inducible protein OsmY
MLIVGLVVGALAGAAAEYVFDPVAGRRRRKTARARMAALARRSAHRSAAELRRNATRSYGKTRGFLHRVRPRPAAELDDAELAHKVESVIFRDSQVPKGRLSINAESGRVFVRGEVMSADLIAAVERAVRGVSGVREVENLMHLPGTPAPASRGGKLLQGE